LQQISDLPANWDGEGARPTDHNLLTVAKAIVREIPVSEIAIPFVAPIAGGGFQLEWSDANKHLEIEFVDGNTIAYLKQEQGPEGVRIDSGEYPLRDNAKTASLLRWFLGEG
jgi:hypothetical protein